MPLTARAQVPGTIDYRGYLTGEAGQPVTNTVSITFRIYDAVSGGVPLWEEEQSGISVVGGRFDAVLGSVTSLMDDPDIEGFDRTLYLALVFGGGELTPRLPLPGSLFSFAAAPTRDGTTRVDCSAGETIGEAIARAPAGGRYVIEVSGDCPENLRIVRDRLTLRGIGGARLLGVAPSEATFGYAIWIWGARSVVIDNLIIEPDAGGTDPARGIITSDNASFSLVNGTQLRNFDYLGIRLTENSVLVVDGSTITGNGNDGVQVFHGSFMEGRGAMVTGNGDDGLSISNNASVVLTDSTVSGNARQAAIVTLGSSLSLEGNNTLESSAPSYNDGLVIGVYDKGSLRVSGPGNVVSNTVPTVYEDSDSFDPFSSGGGFALDIERNSVVRIDRGTTTINGWVYTFNLSTIDIRDAVINGHLYPDGLQANIRFRNQGSAILNGNVRDPTRKFQTRTSPDPEALTVNGLYDCLWGTSGPNVDFQSPSQGYINCESTPTDLGVSLAESADPVPPGTPVTYTATLANVSSAPFVEATNVTVNITVDGSEYEYGSIVSVGSCNDPGPGSFNGPSTVSCFFQGVGPGDATVDVQVTSTIPDTLTVSADFAMPNPDSAGGNNSDSIDTTVSP